MMRKESLLALGYKWRLNLKEMSLLLPLGCSDGMGNPQTRIPETRVIESRVVDSGRQDPHSDLQQKMFSKCDTFGRKWKKALG